MPMLNQVLKQLWPRIPVVLITGIADPRHLDDKLLSIRRAVDQLDSFSHTKSELLFVRFSSESVD